MVRRTLLIAPLLAAAAAPLGCSSADTTAYSPPGDGGVAAPVAKDAASSVSLDAGVIPAIDAATPVSTPDSAPPPVGADANAPVALPFYLSDQFAPSGFMGDSVASQAAITLSHAASACKSPRQTGAGGDCYSVTWAPTVPDGGAAWAGVYWQSPANNWGAKPGKAIAPGATKVRFYAAGAVGGEMIQPCAGGINTNGANASLPYSDTFSVKIPAITLTTTWTRYEISLQGTSYTSVLGGFCWVVSANAAGSETFYIDDLRWE